MSLESHSENKSGIIVSLASPQQTGAIGVIQLAGRGADDLLSRFFSKEVPCCAGEFRMGTFRDAQGAPVDQVLIACVEETDFLFEITCHGGLRIVQRIVDTLERAGAELADGQVLLDRSLGLKKPVLREAYRELIDARTPLAVKFLLSQANGKLFDILTHGSDAERKNVRRYWPAVRSLLTGVKIILLGPPNAGKSTLLNALGHMEHALVADLPGTTRDYVEVQVDLDGIPATLIDTAGLGTTADPLAREVRERTLSQIEQADLIFMVLDATDRNACENFVEAWRQLEKVIVLLNKTDRSDAKCSLSDLNFTAQWSRLTISALNGTQLDQIPQAVWSKLGLAGFDFREPAVFTSQLADLCD